MKIYSDKICRNLKWVKKKDYIESSDSLASDETLKLVNWTVKSKFPIDKIKLDTEKYYNKPDRSQIEYMKKYFYPFGWHPIRININFELIDGQHRLSFAKEAGLKYIDVFIDKNI
jgi:hypothetical protein